METCIFFGGVIIVIGGLGVLAWAIGVFLDVIQELSERG